MKILRGRLLLFTLLLGSSATVSSSTRAESWLPLEIGHTWELTNASGDVWRTRVADEVQFSGSTVFLLKHWTPDGELWNYWSQDSAGTTLLHGFYRPQPQAGVSYDPPLEWLQPDLESGVGWQTQAEVRDLSTGESVGSLTLWARVGSRRTIRLPLGDFRTKPVEYTAATSLAPNVESLLGGTAGLVLGVRGKTVATPDGTLLLQEYSLGHGLVRETVCCPEDVRTMETHRVPNQSTRWGTLKALYGDR